MKELGKTDHFLLKEYESASQLTFHIDDLRNKLTGFFLVFTGVASGGLTLILKGEARDLFEPRRLVALLFMAIGLLGLFIVGILARLRRVQLEHFRIMNNIREYFLQDNARLWSVVELCESTLPLPTNLSAIANRLSGSYLWVVVIMFTTAIIFATSFYLTAIKIYSIVPLNRGRFAAVLLILFLMIFQDRLYFWLAAPPSPPRSTT